jgi:hypothetical protein
MVQGAQLRFKQYRPGVNDDAGPPSRGSEITLAARMAIAPQVAHWVMQARPDSKHFITSSPELSKRVFILREGL